MTVAWSPSASSNACSAGRRRRGRVDHDVADVVARGRAGPGHGGRRVQQVDLVVPVPFQAGAHGADESHHVVCGRGAEGAQVPIRPDHGPLGGRVGGDLFEDAGVGGEGPTHGVGEDGVGQGAAPGSGQGGGAEQLGEAAHHQEPDVHQAGGAGGEQAAK